MNISQIFLSQVQGPNTLGLRENEVFSELGESEGLFAARFPM